MKLVIFDIDGTLIKSTGIESECFWSVARKYLGSSFEPVSWDQFEHVTDAGIVMELLEPVCTVETLHRHVNEFRRRFVELFETELNETAVDTLSGAAELLSYLQRSPRHMVSIVTGSWKRTARLKLAAARLDVSGVPLTTSDDSPRRADLLELAKNRAARLYPPGMPRS